MQATAEQQVRQAWVTFTQAMVDGDTAALNALMDVDFTLTHITGYVQPRTEWLGQIRSGYFDYHHIENQDVAVTVNSNEATLVSRALVEVTIGSGRGNWRLQSTLIFEQRGDSWVALSYVARIY